MRGVMFDNRHSYWDWGLMLKSTPKISAPEVKTHYVDVPGLHGQLDLSTLLTGGVRYKERKIEFEFITMADHDTWPAIYSEILNELHGQKKKITFDDEPTYFYTGRVHVAESGRDKKAVTLKITAEVEPFKKNSEGVEML